MTEGACQHVLHVSNVIWPAQLQQPHTVKGLSHADSGNETM